MFTCFPWAFFVESWCFSIDVLDLNLTPIIIKALFIFLNKKYFFILFYKFYFTFFYLRIFKHKLLEKKKIKLINRHFTLIYGIFYGYYTCVEIATTQTVITYQFLSQKLNYQFCCSQPFQFFNYLLDMLFYWHFQATQKTNLQFLLSFFVKTNLPFFSFTQSIFHSIHTYIDFCLYNIFKVRECSKQKKKLSQNSIGDL